MYTCFWLRSKKQLNWIKQKYDKVVSVAYIKNVQKVKHVRVVLEILKNKNGNFRKIKWGPKSKLIIITINKFWGNIYEIEIRDTNIKFAK